MRGTQADCWRGRLDIPPEGRACCSRSPFVLPSTRGIHPSAFIFGAAQSLGDAATARGRRGALCQRVPPEEIRPAQSQAEMIKATNTAAAFGRPRYGVADMASHAAANVSASHATAHLRRII